MRTSSEIHDYEALALKLAAATIKAAIELPRQRCSSIPTDVTSSRARASNALRNAPAKTSASSQDYIESRRVSDELLRAFGIGGSGRNEGSNPGAFELWA
ncbi:hypothetical protein EVJ58_g7825 [Rhodofomes roseus]|uniref:Uncharacterized protein n=1 Tax=Rhodofomes roseus TaxID=34475 RepID=A0A4Y9Y2Y4_9APHY|nr:hypothetical protein EVJ58_g7825 [Rhodofomes roseus]